MVGESTLYHSVCRKFLKAPALCDRPESSDGSQHRAGRLGPLPPDASPQEATPASACGGGLAGRPKVRPRAGALPRRRAHPEAGRTRGFEVSTGRQARTPPGFPTSSRRPTGAFSPRGEKRGTVRCGVYLGVGGVEANVCFFKSLLVHP